MFIDLKRAWNGIPFDVVNDGDVTALLGSMSLPRGAVLGVALGTSTAGGYVTTDGCITPWLNEIAFVPVDYRPDAPRDEWSGDAGCVVQYLSQQAVGRLIAPAQIDVPASMPLPVRLKYLQALMDAGDGRAVDVYRTLGAYLGYALAHLANVYDFGHVLVLGRVTSGPGGAIMIDTALEVLYADFPELFARIDLSTPGERDKRHGQAIAAASLPALDESSVVRP
jgi:predicted NBD/HSP70 family sugar kinase